ncbi:single-stranded-DNA-specific exonuclease RecJ [Verrucomicrobiota bacterium]
MKIWQTKDSDDNFTRLLIAKLKLPPILAKILSGYNFADPESVTKFLDPKLKDVSDPFTIPQMDAAVRRIWRAIAAKENIMVFGDYDVDGIVSTVLLVKILLRLGAKNVIPCLPDRLEEGYGFSVTSLERCLRPIKPDLIITVDCGITAHESADYVKKSGIDLIITDHHEPAGDLPHALAVINPKIGKSDSLKILAGVGVAFKLCHALLKHGRKEKESSAGFDLKEYLDLVAAGTVADVVPLTDENRIFVRHGLVRINMAGPSAWQKIKEVAALKGKLDAYHLAYCIAPRLNAAGRLYSAKTALELFLTDDEKRAGIIARKLDETNRERQSIEKRILKEAIAEIDGYFDPDVYYGIVAGRRSWHVGVIGIVASRLKARYNRPVVVIGFDEQGKGRGSGRSIAGCNILNALNGCRDALIGFGGHELAAGLDIDDNKLEEFRVLFNTAAEHELKGKNTAQVITVNEWIQLSDVSYENFNALEKLSPFGQMNPIH